MCLGRCLYLLAFAGTIASAVDGITPRFADGLLAVAALPALQTHLLPVQAARVVAETVVPWPAEGSAGGVVVVGRALDPHPVGEGREKGDQKGVPRRSLTLSLTCR